MVYNQKKRGPRESWFNRNVQGSRILDLGFAGYGESAGVQHDIIKKIVPDATLIGLDISLENIKASAAVYSCRVSTVGDGYFLPFKDDVFDLVIMSEIVEHLWNPKAVLEEVNRVLSSGGKVLLTTPHVYSLSKLLRYLFGKNEMGFSDHKILYSDSSIKKLLIDSGFKAKSVEILKLPIAIPRTRIRLTLRRGPAYLSRFGEFLFVVGEKRE